MGIHVVRAGSPPVESSAKPQQGVWGKIVQFLTFSCINFGFNEH